jgi:hypothetical protein
VFCLLIVTIDAVIRTAVIIGRIFMLYLLLCLVLIPQFVMCKRDSSRSLRGKSLRPLREASLKMFHGRVE